MVSVLMTVFNGEKFLKQSIDSVLNQTFKDFEFIIVDDASQDRTWQILEDFAARDKRIVLVRNDTNLGVSNSSNVGLEIARGEYVARLDSDDIALPHRLETQVSYLETHPEVGMVGSQMKVVNAEGQEKEDYIVPRLHGEILWTLFFGNPMAHPTIMFRKSIVDDVGGYGDSLRASLDKDLYVRMINKTRFANLDQALVKYRRHERSIWATQSKLAHSISSRVGRQLASVYLESEVPEVEWDLFDNAINGAATLSDFEIKKVIKFILKLYDAVAKKEQFQPDELEAIHADLARRILTIGKKDGRILGEDVPRRYWKSVFPNVVWKTLSALRYPRRAVSRIFRYGKNVPKTPKKTNVSTDNYVIPDMNNYGQKPDGISIVVVSYERLGALKKLLSGLLSQDFEGIDTEIIIVNNSHRVCIPSLRHSKISNLLRKFPQTKVINSSFNWGPGIRYCIATAASYRTILFFDDDIYPTHPAFVASMYRTFRSLNPADILTCWADLWVDWTNDSLSTVSMGFTSPQITELTECDYCGTGISMFDKRILMHPEMLDIPLEFKFADTAWFPWIPSIVHGTRKYYFPSYGMLMFHNEQLKSSLSRKEGYENFIFEARRNMLERGYQPVLERLQKKPWLQNSPAQIAAKVLPVLTRPW